MDTELTGFGYRLKPSGAANYFIKYVIFDGPRRRDGSSDRRKRWPVTPTSGHHKSPAQSHTNPEAARDSDQRTRRAGELERAAAAIESKVAALDSAINALATAFTDLARAIPDDSGILVDADHMTRPATPDDIARAVLASGLYVADSAAPPALGVACVG